MHTLPVDNSIIVATMWVHRSATSTQSLHTMTMNLEEDYVQPQDHINHTVSKTQNALSQQKQGTHRLLSQSDEANTAVQGKILLQVEFSSGGKCCLSYNNRGRLHSSAGPQTPFEQICLAPGTRWTQVYSYIYSPKLVI